MFKYHGTEHNKERVNDRASGKAGVAWDGNEFDESETCIKSWLRTKGNSIEGGTSEVQLNVISKRVQDYQAREKHGTYIK